MPQPTTNMNETWRLGWLLVLFFAKRVLCEAQCFGIGGQKSSATPCNSDATGSNGSHSACCDESKQEACLSTGLCYATQRSDNITFWAEGCTDPSGLDPLCPQYCGVNSQFVTGRSPKRLPLIGAIPTVHLRSAAAVLYPAILRLQLLVLLL